MPTTRRRSLTEVEDNKIPSPSGWSYKLARVHQQTHNTYLDTKQIQVDFCLSVSCKQTHTQRKVLSTRLPRSDRSHGSDGSTFLQAHSHTTLALLRSQFLRFALWLISEFLLKTVGEENKTFERDYRAEIGHLFSKWRRRRREATVIVMNFCVRCWRRTMIISSCEAQADFGIFYSRFHGSASRTP